MNCNIYVSGTRCCHTRDHGGCQVTRLSHAGCLEDRPIEVSHSVDSAMFAKGARISIRYAEIVRGQAGKRSRRDRS